MSTKILTGTYTPGYAIALSTTVLSITGSGFVGGSGISAAAGAALLIVNYGRVSSDGDGIALTGAGTVPPRMAQWGHPRFEMPSAALI